MANVIVKPWIAL